LWESARHGSVAVDFRRFGADMAGIATRLWMGLVGWVMLGLLLPHAGGAAGTTISPEGPPLDITAERIEYLQETETYEADGSVVVNQGALRLTADHMTIQALPGVLIATGHVRLTDPKADLVTERLELNVNTEAGVVTHGRVHLKSTNTSIEGRLLQRFSEDHYRVKEGRFTNCDAQKGETPAWRFEFKDLDLRAGDNVEFTGAWLCVNDVPVIPIPTMTYPLTKRRTGFLIPTVGWDSRFGIHLQESFFWAINPSQDLTVSPFYYSSLGYGSEFKYRYVLDRQSRGQWYVNALQETETPNLSGVSQGGQPTSQARALIRGTHTQQFTPDLLLRVQANLVTDSSYLQQLSNSGAQRALPSAESNFFLNRRLSYGNTYLLGQYLQPLQSGGPDTFQRLPEIGYNLPNLPLFSSPVLLGAETTYVYFYREQGFDQNRVDILPGLSTDVLNFGHIVGLTPQVKVREVYYTHGAQNSENQNRETFWAGIDATSKLSRRYRTSEGNTLLHTVEPSVTYEYVPSTNQSQLTLIDQVDSLPYKNLMTYAIRSRLLEQTGSSSFNWLDFTMAQSYHMGAVQTSAANFTPGVPPLIGTPTQPLQPATVPVDGKKFSDLWLKAVIGNTSPKFTPAQSADGSFSQAAGGVLGQQAAINQYLTIDAFFDPYRLSVNQFNTDFRVQQSNYWYLQVGQRFTQDGNRVRRGDVWNPISFNEVYAPTPEVEFLTAAGAFRTPWGWTFGAKSYYDVLAGKSSETDVVGLYQNPCKCWSLGVYYILFPDRQQYSFMLSLTGIGWTDSFGTALVRSILSPLLIGEKGLPWSVPGGPYGRPQSDMPQPEMVGIGR
jgi:LPS-assembly protein